MILERKKGLLNTHTHTYIYIYIYIYIYKASQSLIGQSMSDTGLLSSERLYILNRRQHERYWEARTKMMEN